MPYWHSLTSLCMGYTLLTWPLIPIGLLYSNSHFDQIWCVASIGGGVNKIRNSWPPPSEWNLIDVNNMQFFSLIKKELYIRIFFFKGWGRVHNFEKSHSHFIILIFDNKSNTPDTPVKFTLMTVHHNMAILTRCETVFCNI